MTHLEKKPCLKMPPGDINKGKRIFMERCAQCHTTEKDGKHLEGPNLHGMWGRMCGRASGFEFTPQHKAKGVKWEENSLYCYLENPRKFVPGTSMMFPGLKKPEDRAHVIAYLKNVTSGDASTSDAKTPKGDGPHSDKQKSGDGPPSGKKSAKSGDSPPSGKNDKKSGDGPSPNK